MTFPYFEIGWSGNAWFPESLMYIIPKFSDIWGTSDGVFLQQWCKQNRRPLVWADGDNSGMLLDPFVNSLDYEGNQSYITPAMAAAFTGACMGDGMGCNDSEAAPQLYCVCEHDSCALCISALWKPVSKDLTFAKVMAAMDPALHMQLPTYANKQICASVEALGEKVSVLGTNGKGQVVHFAVMSMSNWRIDGMSWHRS